MNSHDFDVRLTPEARRMLRPGEALVLILRCKRSQYLSCSFAPSYPRAAPSGWN
jgi:hypothetical protein